MNKAPRIQRQFQELLDSRRHRIIAFEGEPGNGKSRLAREILRARLERGGTVAYIRNDQLLSDIAGALVASSIKINKLEGVELRRAFAAHICSRQAPTYVLLDGMEERTTVEELVPPAARSIVVLSSRKEVLPRARGKAIPVKEMEEDEAADLVHKIRPQTSEEEVRQLVAAMGARPLPIEHACGLIGDGKFYSISQFCADISRDAADTLGRAIKPTEWTLTWIYEKLLDKLRAADDAVDREAAVLLQLIAFLGPEAMPYELLVGSFRHMLAESGEQFEEVECAVRFQSATRALERHYLIDERSDGLSIHRLTQAIFRGLLYDHRLRTCLHLHEAIEERLGNLGPKLILDAETLAWLPHIQGTVYGLNQFDVTAHQGVNLGRTISVLLRGLLQVGDRQGAMGLVEKMSLMFAIDDLTSPELRDACFEWASLAHANGTIPKFIYFMAIRKLVLDDPARGTGQSIEQQPRLITDCAGALISDGESQEALTLLLEERETVSEHSSDSAEIADFSLTLGRAFNNLGYCLDAQVQFEAALSFYQKHPREEVRISGTVHTVQLLVDNALMGHLTDTSVADLIETSSDAWESRTESFQDARTEARYKMTLARVVANGIFAGIVLQISNSGQWKPTDSIERQVRTFFNAWGRIRALHTEAASFVEDRGLDYEFALLATLVRPELVPIVINSVSSIEYEFDVTGKDEAIVMIALAKTAYVLGKEDQPSASLVNYWKYLSFELAYRSECAYWYAEALGLACIGAVKIADPEWRALTKAARSTYIEIGRSDRWAQLAKVLRVCGSSREDFLKEAAVYLLV